MKQIFSKSNRALVSELVRTDFKLRYQGSVLGYVWSLLSPLLLFIILYFVYVNFLHVGDNFPHYAVYLLLGIVSWNFFKELTNQSLQSIVMRGDLIRKVSIPRWIIVASTSLSALINLALNSIILFVLAMINKLPLGFAALLLPLMLLQIYIFGLAVSLFLSCWYVKYRDISYIWEVFIQAGFFLTPILYPLSKISSLTFQKIMLLNPVAVAIQDARYVFVTKSTITTHSVFKHGWYSFLPYVVSLLLIVGGVFYFKKQSKSFAENI